MPASGFMAYENYLVALYTGVIQQRYDGDTSVPSLNTVRGNLTSNGVDANALTAYESLLIARETGMVGPRYDGDFTIDNQLALMRTSLAGSYTGDGNIFEQPQSPPPQNNNPL